MKNNFNFKAGKKLVIKSVTSICLISFLSCAGCDVVRVSSETNNSEISTNYTYSSTTSSPYESQITTSERNEFQNINRTETTSTTDATSTTDITSTTETSDMYDFDWNYNIDIEFDSFVAESGNGCGVTDYTINYGLDDNPILQTYFDEFVNDRYGTSYNNIPFSEARYFNRGLNRDGAFIEHLYVDDEDYFDRRFLYEESDLFHAENPMLNKCFLSYLVWSGKPFGEFFGYSDYVAINPDFSDDMLYDIVENNFINPVSNRDWSTQDNMCFSLYLYNSNLYYICVSEAVYDMKIYNKEDLCNALNEYLVNYYGENAPQFGQPFTREMYVEMFGEEPIQFEFLPEAPVMLSDNPSRQR